LRAVVDLATGHIIQFNASKGYGFIEQDGGGEDVFIHVNELGDCGTSVRLGTRVEFNVLESVRGLKACDITIVDRTEEPVRPAVSPMSPDGSRNAADSMREAEDDYVLEVIPRTEYAREITDTLIELACGVTASEITSIRQRLVDFADRRGWLDS
jgi:CspA family cold shock protein